MNSTSLQVTKKFLSCLLALALLMPMFIHAEEVEPTPPVSVPVPEQVDTVDVAVIDEPVAEIDTSTEVVQSDDAQVVAEETTLPVVPEEPAVESDTIEPTAEIIQETAAAQDPLTGDVLEGTANPEQATSTDAEIIPLIEATSTEPVVETAPVVEVETVPVDVVEIPMPPVEELSTVAEPLTPVVATVPTEVVLQVDEDPKYLLAVSGQTIPTKKRGMIGTTALTAPVNTSIVGDTGMLNVSGACASPYFVVLIFKNQTDYETDPRSFIVNRAYACENGSYSYSIDRLPSTLPDGTYYLLIGEQGEQGPWTPVTGLTEITINRSN